MNKKDISDLKKEFKIDGMMLKVKDLRSIYLKKDNFAVIHSDFNYFDRLDIEKQELYLNNCKKLLTGGIDTKLFELEFKDTDSEVNTQGLLINILKSTEGEEMKASVDKIVQKVSENFNYDTDILISIIKAEYWKGVNKKYEDAEESLDDYMTAFEFLLVSINKIESPKASLKFDFEAKEFKVNSALDSIINLNSPIEGFLFPTFSGGYSDVNKILYYTSKAGSLNPDFLEGVLNCSKKLTASDEKECFTSIVTSVIGDKINTETLQDIYEKITDLTKENEEDGQEATLGMKDIKRVLASSGIENVENLEEAFEETCGKNYDFKVNNIVPNFNTKSIKITNENTNITLTPKDLRSIRQVKDKQGRKCLLIEINEDVIIEGFKIETSMEEI